MISEFLLGLLLSIPIGIGVNWITPSLQKYWASTSKERALKRSKSIKSDYDQIIKYKDNPVLLTQFLIICGIRITRMVGRLILVLLGIEIVSYAERYTRDTQILNLLNLAQIIIYVLSGFVFYLSFFVIRSIAHEAINAWYRANHFGEYEASVKEHLDAVTVAESAAS